MYVHVLCVQCVRQYCCYLSHVKALVGCEVRILYMCYCSTATCTCMYVAMLTGEIGRWSGTHVALAGSRRKEVMWHYIIQWHYMYTLLTLFTSEGCPVVPCLIACAPPFINVWIHPWVVLCFISSLLCSPKLLQHSFYRTGHWRSTCTRICTCTRTCIMCLCLSPAISTCKTQTQTHCTFLLTGTVVRVAPRVKVTLTVLHPPTPLSECPRTSE